MVCIAGILGFIFMAVYPSRNALMERDRDIAELKAQIEEQKILTPLYKDLLERSEPLKTLSLPLPKRKKLDQNEIGRLSIYLEEIAARSHFELVGLVPDVDSLAQVSGLLSVNARLKGDFINFRDCFILLGALPYLEHIEEIRVRSTGGGQEFSLKLWLALKR